ncbi:hypothetical protein [Gloeothece verrucosa]|uniref:Uncharacterized protein n=1 Tax=Gloeothece verrucosa (strain PCC 7822) TaxID=497965 RepID=E0UDQ2_GLOV7|nr:hypothetical protein [Gloeothece verrucosa]ADN16487.1 hypothetical protein Cyan7822_4578 [Gloeothece verrucosa PCC 7822]
MSEIKVTKIEIRAPKFDQYELVGLEWNGKHYAVKIGQRWLNFEDGSWWYKIAGNDQKLFPESVFYIPEKY